MSTFPFFPRAQSESYNDLDVCSFVNPHAPWQPHHQPAPIKVTQPAYWEFDQQQQQPVIDEYRTSQFGFKRQKYYHGDVPGIVPVNNLEMPPTAEEYSVPINSSKKKAFHNLRERTRRRTLKVLYCQLRSLLPSVNPKRKLSIPNTVNKVLKYIPDLRIEIERLSRERDELLAAAKRSISETSPVTSKSASNTEAEGLIDFMHSPPPSGSLASPDRPTVTVNAELGRSQIMITIYNCRLGFRFSRLLSLLEKEGLDVLNASSFMSQDKVCYDLHLEMIAGRSEIDKNILQKKLMTLLCDKSFTDIEVN